MSAIIEELQKSDGTKVYPVTKASACYINGKDTVDRVLMDLNDGDTSYKFEDNGNITQTLASGNVNTIEFKANTIVETLKTKEGVLLQEKTTTFNADGTINIKIKEEDM